jgi:hypothetical protein
MTLKFSPGGRTDEEKIVDRLLVLYTLTDCPNEIGDTVLQKLTFLSSLDLKLQGEKGFNYNYIKLSWGPYSPDLAKDIDDLIKCGLVTDKVHSLTPFGVQLMEFIKPIIERNLHITRKIHEVNEKYCMIPREDLVHMVHAMKNPERPRFTIHETKDGSYILKRQKIWVADREFNISESELASLEILLDLENMDALNTSIREAREKPSILYKSA